MKKKGKKNSRVGGLIGITVFILFVVFAFTGGIETTLNSLQNLLSEASILNSPININLVSEIYP